MFAIFPAVANIFSIIPILFFKLEGKEFERRMAELEELNRKKEALAAGVEVE